MEISMTLNQDPEKLFKDFQGDMKPARKAGMTNWLDTVEAVAVKDAPNAQAIWRALAQAT